MIRLRALALVSCMTAFAFGRPADLSQMSEVNRSLYTTLSKKQVVPSGGATRLYGNSRTSQDTVHIVALRVQFRKDSSALTTGDGTFAGIAVDQTEINAYKPGGAYKYDRTDHDSLYCANQLGFAARYFSTVSKNKLTLTYQVFPAGKTEAYTLQKTMTDYSPGGKQKTESWNEYYTRQTKGLVAFVKDALREASSSSDPSWLTALTYDPARKIFKDSLTNHRVVFLIIHAGASSSTDGLKSYPNSPSDMIDAFFSQDFFKSFFTFFHDAQAADTTGVIIKRGTDSLLIDEVMMVSQTANQDGLNWGIHGILINQIARQLGIPDLYSTLTGLTGVGGFCVMDAGLMGGSGFFPPWPSAWVRSYMGWDDPVVIPRGLATQINLVAPQVAQPGDTTIAMVPLNNHEYYLIENRQRMIPGNGSWFALDTVDKHNDSIFIAGYPFSIKLDSVVARTLSPAAQNQIDSVKNFDASLPASGCVVWHIDEDIVRQRIAYNMINADSQYLGVRLVEGDGINDIGVQFINQLSENVYDYGGAEDVFPHRIEKYGKADRLVDSIGPYTRPSTKSNDGGQTGVSLKFSTTSPNPAQEYNAIRGYFVDNYADSVMRVDIRWDSVTMPLAAHTTYPAPHPRLLKNFPMRVAPDTFMEPVPVNLYTGNIGSEICFISRSGRVSLVDKNGTSIGYFTDTVSSQSATIFSDTGSLQAWYLRDTVHHIGRLPARPITGPTTIGKRIFIPCSNSTLVVIDSLVNDSMVHHAIALPANASSYCLLSSKGTWVMGCNNGTLVWGDTTTGNDSIQGTKVISTGHAITALALLHANSDTLICALSDGSVTAINLASSTNLQWPHRIQNGIAPYALATADCDGNGTAEIFVTDSRQGLWCLTQNGTIAQGWSSTPLDNASAYFFTETPASFNRDQLPVNASPASIADIDGDGLLDVLLSGINGVFAFNYKGTPLNGWPSYLDQRFWYYRGSVMAPPLVARYNSASSFVFYASPTGNRETFTFYKIDSTNAAHTKVYYVTTTGTRDSIIDLSKPFVDTLLTYADSLVSNFTIPGGFINILDKSGKNPTAIASLPGTGPERISPWPVSLGGPSATTPLLADIDGSGIQTLWSVAPDGAVYAWDIPGIQPLWPMVGATSGRIFTQVYDTAQIGKTSGASVTLMSYPNPVIDEKNVTFRYSFSGPAENAVLEIFTATGYRAWSQNLGSFLMNWRGANTTTLPLAKFGAGVYRCRIEAAVSGKKVHAYWKMAVVK